MDDDLFEIIRQEWRAAASTLADWSMAHLVNRKDVWGQYTELSAAEKLNSKRGYKALTLPQKKMRGKDMVTLDKLTRHFRSTSVGHLIGLHATSAENTSRWLALDIDWHDPEALDADEGARRNLAAALAWWEELQQLGYDPLLLDSNGAGGFHILTLFEEPVPTADVHALGHHLVASWKQKNVDGAPECFPKSASVEGEKLGSWLRVFGMHHTQRHFTRVWSGDPWLDEPWLEGSAAIDAILNVRLSPPPPRVVEDLQPLADKGRRPKASFPTSTKPVVCVDFDGVLAVFDGWRGKAHFGEPVPGALEFVRRLSTFSKVLIHSARLSAPDAEPGLRAWFKEHGFPEVDFHLGVGKPLAKVYIDDRALLCRPQEMGPAAFLLAEDEVRRRCEVREEGAALDGLARIVSAWPNLSDSEREALLRLL